MKKAIKSDMNVLDKLARIAMCLVGSYHVISAGYFESVDDYTKSTNHLAWACLLAIFIFKGDKHER